MKKIVFLLVIFSCEVKAQHLAAFFDSNNDFAVFDDGIEHVLSHDTITNYGIGGDFLVYVNSQNQFIYYYKGDSVTLEYDDPFSYSVSQNFLVYKWGQKLKMVEKGILKTLCAKVEKFVVGDSIIAWTDKTDSTLKVYYNGETKIVEKGAKKMAVSQFSASQNLVTYIALNNDLKVWSHGKNYFLSKEGQATGFQIGTDLVAFAAQPDNVFNIFYKGEIFTFPKIFPRLLRMNNNSIAYVDQYGHFIIFYEGKNIMITKDEPFNFSANWNEVSFIHNNTYMTFFKGEVHKLDEDTSAVYTFNDGKTINTKIPIGNAALFYPQNSFIFYDRTGVQNIFFKGDLPTGQAGIRKNTSWQTEEKLKGIQDLIVFTDAFGKTTVYYKGRKY